MEGLLSTGPTPSSFVEQQLFFGGEIIRTFLHLCIRAASVHLYCLRIGQRVTKRYLIAKRLVTTLTHLYVLTMIGGIERSTPSHLKVMYFAQ